MFDSLSFYIKCLNNKALISKGMVYGAFNIKVSGISFARLSKLLFDYISSILPFYFSITQKSFENSPILLSLLYNL